ncbi:hypothetical protein BX600DRAFT_207816 [Xylariales sp. PMI_506]|nr:hypothetical protein BX600DRAFT_207816 [Xylariales sp. PMI_506]
MSQPRPLSLYTGVSDRSRGWKSRKPERSADEEVIESPSNLLRWDGVTRTTLRWDGWKKDPELWFGNGDCFVHLHEQGFSRRGPIFRIPFQALLNAKCYPLINRFMPPPSPPLPDIAGNAKAPSKPKYMELYMAAPPGSNRQQTINYHVATRNFFAFIYRRPLIGEHLGSALIGLMRSMQAFRNRKVKNLNDLISYMQEQGYFDITNEPAHAVAILHLAEELRLRDLYIDAFAHCCGMNERLFRIPEYQLLSSATRKLLWRARVEMDLRISRMGSMLSTFLQDELSEAHLGLYGGARAHLERFRTLLQGFYATKFGYYPPPSIDPRITMFEVDVLRAMRTDFEALFEYMVDVSFDPSQNIPPLAQGGICAFQSVQSFDTRSKFTTLNHPLPLLPQVPAQAYSRRMPWFHKQVKIASSLRPNLHVAMLKATNQDKIELLDNDLVRVYRKFEEDCIYSRLKADKLESLDLVDARKVRWILIYAMYQTLRQATQPPPEVRGSAYAPYNICISTENLPPWKDAPPPPLLARRHTDLGVKQRVEVAEAINVTPGSVTPPRTPNFEIKPDIDYLAIAQQDSAVGQPRSPKLQARRVSLTRSLSRNSKVRRSLRLFSLHNPPTDSLAESQTPRKPLQFQEIMVQGYGNGINDVELLSSEEQASVGVDDDTPAEPVRGLTAARSLSTSSNSSNSANSANSANSGKSEDGSASTADTTLTEPIVENEEIKLPSVLSYDSRRSTICVEQRARVVGFVKPAGRPKSLRITSRLSLHQPTADDAPPIPKMAPQRSRSMLIETRKTIDLPPMPIRAAPLSPSGQTEKQDLHDLLQIPLPKSATWSNFKDVPEVRTVPVENAFTTSWDDYNDLGGLTELKDVRPKRASLWI